MKAFVALIITLYLTQYRALEKLKLSSGYEIPVVGFGTAGIYKVELGAERIIRSALDNGYRHIDTAFAYRNEAIIGKTIKKWLEQGGKREDLFITSKLPEYAMKAQSVERYFNWTMKNLGLDYIDMYLIHQPIGVNVAKDLYNLKNDPYEVFEEEDDVDHVGIWKEMEKQVKKGRVRSIGLSNFNEAQISNIYKNAEIKPSNLQVECHVYLQQPALRKFCKDKNIVMTAYAPLGSQSIRDHLFKGTAKEFPPAAQLPIVEKLAKKYDKSASQILLRHLVRSGLVVIPKSTNPTRQKEDISLFDFKLSDEEMKQLNALDKGERGRVYDLIKVVKDVEKNKNYPFGRI